MKRQHLMLSNMILGLFSLFFFLVLSGTIVCYKLLHSSLRQKPRQVCY